MLKQSCSHPVVKRRSVVHLLILPFSMWNSAFVVIDYIDPCFELLRVTKKGTTIGTAALEELIPRGKTNES